MKQNPTFLSKTTGDDVPFAYDYSNEFARFGDSSIVTSSWTVDSGTVVLGAGGRTPTAVGSVVTCFVSGGAVGETAVLNSSIKTNTGNKFVRRFAFVVKAGSYELV